MTPQDQENIIAYLRDELSEDQENKFLASLETDKELNQEFLVHKQLFDALGADSWSQSSEDNQEYESLVALAKSDQLQRLKSSLKEAEAAHQLTKDSTTFINWRVWSVAAVLLAVVGIFSVLNSTPDYQELFDQYSDKTSISSVIERGDTMSNLEVQIETAHREKKYLEAISLSQSLDLSQVKNAAIILYMGDSNVRLGQYNDALEIYNYLINSNLLDAPKGLWFKALTYLKMEDITNTKATLQYIVANNLHNAALAKELLTEL